ncbi:MAG TPA: patatin-like phospholipase family protein [Sphingomonas sp.]|nr:patatin-like phospholipase family protein [Sphingomonas sp.]
MTTADHVALVLGGGNALGAYQAGAYAALHRHGLPIHRIVGASAGAINGALIAGNAPEDRLARLAGLWQPAPGPVPASWMPQSADTARRSLAATWALTTGRTGIFRPRGTALWQAMVGADHPGMYDTSELEATLRASIDVDRLNAGDIAYAATAVDLESGEDVVFDTAEMVVTPTHVRASSALPPAFPPIEIEGRWYVDAGLSANLPLDPILAAPRPGTTLCIAIDLLPLASPRPQSLGEVTERTQDLIFAAQSRRTLARWQAVAAAQGIGPDTPSVHVVHLQYAAQEREISGKAFDFSPETAHERWAAGEHAMTGLLDALDRGSIAIGIPGLTVTTLRPDGR